MAKAKVLIVGGGFAGLSAVDTFARRTDVDVTLLDARTGSHFLPLLPDVIGRTIHRKFLVLPLEPYCRPRGVTFRQARAEQIDLAGKRIRTNGEDLPYDYLLLACGTETNFFGQDDLRRQCLKVDSFEDALAIRQAAEDHLAANFIISGGGYTGVEVATNLWRLLRGRRGDRRLIIVDPAPHLVGMVPDKLREYVEGDVRRLGIEVYLGTRVDHIDGENVHLTDGQVVPDARVIWTAGVQTGEQIQALDRPKLHQGRLAVDASLRVGDRCFAAGDVAGFEHEGNLLRLGIQYSLAEGATAAGNILAAVGDRSPQAFRPWDPGYVVPMADGRGCGRAMGVPVSGWAAYFLHYFMCVFRTRGPGRQWGLVNDLLGGR